VTPPALLTSLRRLVAHIVSALTGGVDLHTDLADIREDLKKMATKAETEQMLTDLSATVTDYIGDVNAKMTEMNTKLDAALAASANDAAQEAQIAELKQITDDVVTRGTAITDAIKAADASVDRPTP